jgi:hypothetical protein
LMKKHFFERKDLFLFVVPTILQHHYDASRLLDN